MYHTLLNQRCHVLLLINQLNDNILSVCFTKADEKKVNRYSLIMTMVVRKT